ncbi:MAG: flagellar hook-associated protein FlgK [Vampirovibrionales bacterium]|nr:flagellar hook-associated protein FlgK [Vampirovibrionales bacterium]
MGVISPGFFGMLNAHRSMSAIQSAIEVVNQNVSNANTAGYTRQQVILEASDPYPPMNLTQLRDKGLLGTGVQVDRIDRVRDNFLDGQFRLENATLGHNDTIQTVLTQLESILAEPSDTGISTAMQKFFNSAEALSIHPESMAARADYFQSASDMLQVFQQQATQLNDLRTNLVGDAAVSGSAEGSQLGLRVTEVNEKLQTIANLNTQISTVTAAGGAPNDLLDKRDTLLDELSNLANISVTALANNQISVSLGGQTLIRGTQLLDTLQVVANTAAAPAPDNDPTLVQTVNGLTTLNSTITSGKLSALLTMGGNGTGVTTVRSVMGELSTLLETIATQVNSLQTAGRDMDGNASPPAIFDLAAGSTLSIFRYSMNATVQGDLRQIAAAIDDPTATSPAGFAGVGDGRNALAMAQLKNTNLAALGNIKLSEFFNTTLSTLGVDSRAYRDRSESQKNVVDTLQSNRQSVSSVNIDEEMINLIKFQRAFEASSRLVRAYDEVAQTLIRLGQ